MSSFEKWLDRHLQLCDLAIKLIKKYRFKSSIIMSSGRPFVRPFIRMFVGSKTVDFFIKEVGSRFVKTVWLCKAKDFNEELFFLIHFRKEGGWGLISGSDVKKYSERRISDRSEKKVEMVVVSSDYIRSAHVFFKRAKARYESALQRRLPDFSETLK